MPETDDLESSALIDAGQEWEEDDDEERAESKTLQELDPNDLSLTGPEDAEVGRGNEDKG